MFNPNYYPTNPEKPYLYQHDPKWFTRILIESGYRLYQLTLTPKSEDDEPMRLRVWAKPVVSVLHWITRQDKETGEVVKTQPLLGYQPPDLSAIAEGTVTPLPLKGEEVTDSDFILHDTKDGAVGDATGVIVVGRTRTLPKKGGEDEFEEKAA
jgi:hypothetical protein